MMIIYIYACVYSKYLYIFFVQIRYNMKLLLTLLLVTVILTTIAYASDPLAILQTGNGCMSPGGKINSY